MVSGFCSWAFLARASCKHFMFLEHFATLLAYCLVLQVPRAFFHIWKFLEHHSPAMTQPCEFPVLTSDPKLLSSGHLYGNDGLEPRMPSIWDRPGTGFKKGLLLSLTSFRIRLLFLSWNWKLVLCTFGFMLTCAGVMNSELQSDSVAKARLSSSRFYRGGSIIHDSRKNRVLPSLDSRSIHRLE